MGPGSESRLTDLLGVCFCADSRVREASRERWGEVVARFRTTGKAQRKAQGGADPVRPPPLLSLGDQTADAHPLTLQRMIIRLRDMTSEAERDQRNRISELERDLSETSGLQGQSDLQTLSQQLECTRLTQPDTA